MQIRLLINNCRTLSFPIYELMLDISEFYYQTMHVFCLCVCVNNYSTAFDSQGKSNVITFTEIKENVPLPSVPLTPPPMTTVPRQADASPTETE